MSSTNVKRIHADLKTLFRYWLEFLAPYHKLRSREIEALSLFLFYRNEISKDVKSLEFVEKLLFSKEIRAKIKEDLGGMSNVVFNNLLTTLRKKGVITKDNKINPVLIPRMDDDSDGFKLIFDFEVKR